MKESFERIIAWAKQHKVLAALIVIGVIVLAWWTMRNRGSGGGGGSVSPAPSGSPDGGASASMGDFGGGAGITPIPASPPVDIPPSPNPISISGNGGGGGGGGGFDIGGSFGDLGMIDQSSGFGALTSPMPASILSGSDFASGGGVQSPTMQNLQPATGPIKTASGITVKTPAKLYTTQEIKKANKPIGGKRSYNLPQTPAQEIGKGRLFTGTVNGVIYVAGFPVGSGGYTPSGGYSYTGVSNVTKGSAVAGQTYTNIVSQQMLNYGSQPKTSEPLPASGVAVMHGH